MDNNILSVLIAVFKFIEANEIKTVADLEGKMLSSGTTDDESVLKWNYCISAESLSRYLKDNEIETQDDWDEHTDEVSKTLMCDDIDDFADVRSKLDQRQEYKELLDSIYHSADELMSTAEGIRSEADI
jgi:hypothetical protein